MWSSIKGADFALENFFWTVKMTKNADLDEEKHSGYGTEFDARGSFPLLNGSEIGKSVITFGANMNSPLHIDNKKKNILILGKGLPDGLDDTMLTAEKEYSINFTKKQKHFWLSLHYNGMNRYMFVKGVEIYKFKAKDSEINTLLLCLYNVSKDVLGNNMKKTRLYRYAVEFLVEYSYWCWWYYWFSQIFNEKAWHKIMFRLIKQVFIALLSSSGSLVSMVNVTIWKCVSLNNEPCEVNLF